MLATLREWTKVNGFSEIFARDPPYFDGVVSSEALYGYFKMRWADKLVNYQWFDSPEILQEQISDIKNDISYIYFVNAWKWTAELEAYKMLQTETANPTLTYDRIIKHTGADTRAQSGHSSNNGTSDGTRSAAPYDSETVKVTDTDNATTTTTGDFTNNDTYTRNTTDTETQSILSRANKSEIISENVSAIIGLSFVNEFMREVEKNILTAWN